MHAFNTIFNKIAIGNIIQTNICNFLHLVDTASSIDGIRQIVGISERLTKEYLELCDKYENSEFKSKLDELAETVKIYKPPATYKKGG